MTYDGTPIQAGTQPHHVELTGQQPHYSIIDLREAVVVSRRFVDEPGNRSHSYVEYDCRDLHSMEPYVACRRLNLIAGLDDGEDHVLRPASGLLPGAIGNVSETTPAINTDGDRVLVGFINGSRSRCVILGVLTHVYSRYGAERSDGERRLWLHKGTRIEIKKDGTYVVKAISTSTGVSIDGHPVKLGENATQPMIRGDDFKTLVMQELQSASTSLQAAAATATAQLIPGTLPSTIASLTTVIGALSSLASLLAAAYSQYPGSLSSKNLVE